MDPDRDHLLAELFGDTDVPAGLGDRLLRTGEVARLFQVSERTVAEWARSGKMASLRTPGGHRLYPAEEVRRVLERAGEWPGETAVDSAGSTSAPGDAQPGAVEPTEG